ncbi:hypothetical protein GCM10027446_14640 [Angustibacter peucedani]
MLLAGTAVVLSLASALYIRLGWWQMERVCSSRQESWTQSWSWRPLGFECDFESQATETRWWPWGA